jgi:1-acyl-sn-glycerol-3-phosphate acyltransferase
VQFEVKIVLETLKVSLPTLFYGAIGRLDRDTTDQRLRNWGQALLDLSDLALDLEGREAIDWTRAFVVMSNHQSLYDIPALAVAVPGSLRFVAKKELFRVPIWGRAMREAGIIPVDRQNREKAIDSMKVAADAVRQGIHIGIFPEGTRSPDGRLLPLKKGGFMVALETGTPIVPIAISGTKDAWRKHQRTPLKGLRARVRFGAPIEVAGKSRDELMEEVRAYFVENVEGA